MEENKNEISIEQVLKAIDFELDVINKESTRPGWTKWAIYGAFAAIGWLLVGLYENQTFSYLNIAQLYLVFRFIPSGVGVTRILHPNNELQIDNFQKFSRASNFIDFEVLLASFLLNLIELFIAIFASNNVWMPQTFIVSFGLILIIAMQIYQFWQLNVEYPSSFTQTKMVFVAKLSGFTLGGIAFLITLWAISGYFFAAYNRGINLADIKIALLLFATSFLYNKLFTKPAPDKIKNDLIELRRHIIFSDIDAQKARFELKKITGKLSPSEFINDLYQDCFLTASLQLGAVDCSLKIINEVQGLLSENYVGGDLIASKLKEEREHRIWFENRKEFAEK